MKRKLSEQNGGRRSKLPLLRLHSAAEIAAAKEAFYASASALKIALQSGGAVEIRVAQRSLQETLAAYRNMR
jgi:hypothetical protein